MLQLKADIKITGPNTAKKRRILSRSNSLPSRMAKVNTVANQYFSESVCGTGA